MSVEFKTTKALLVEDDEEDFLILVKSMSENPCCSLVHSKSLKESLTNLVKERFDVIILDLNLPDSTGLDTLVTIRRQAHNTPIVVLTGVSDEMVALEAIKSGAQDYISKDELDAKSLKRTVFYAIERHKLLMDIQEREDKINDLYLALEYKNKELLELSIRDPLTMLYNRRFIDENLELEFIKSKRYKYNLFFLLCDVDKFKQVNDTKGHMEGDRVLINVSRILTDSIRHSDICGRYGGDEFVIFGRLQTDDADIVVRRILKNISDNQNEGLKLGVTISIGCTVLHEGIESIKMMETAADEALYMAKESGRNAGFIKQSNEMFEVKIEKEV
jgi:diguanylate cyclase (GGDEF)-like protein